MNIKEAVQVKRKPIGIDRLIGLSVRAEMTFATWKPLTSALTHCHGGWVRAPKQPRAKTAIELGPMHAFAMAGTWECSKILTEFSKVVVASCNEGLEPWNFRRV